MTEPHRRRTVALTARHLEGGAPRRLRPISRSWSLALMLACPAGLAAQGAVLHGPCKPDTPADLLTVEAAPDTAPQLLGPPPRFPPFALRDGYRGTVHVAVVVDTSGRAESRGAVILAASDSELRDWACGYVRLLRFIPARHQGRAVRAQVVVPFEFSANVRRRTR